VGIGGQKLDTIESHPARLREDAQQPDMIAAIPLRSFSMLQRRSNTEISGEDRHSGYRGLRPLHLVVGRPDDSKRSNTARERAVST
jgi:hypothetical protein